MNPKIPDELKADLPLSQWGKILGTTPVVMAVVSTLLAGLASSEMTRAQYDRALAAQQQSKAGDQWNYFQAKKLRGALQQNTLDVVQSTGEVHPLDPATLRRAAEQLPDGAGSPRSEILATLNSAAGQQAVAALVKGELPEISPGPALDAKLKAAADAVANSRPETEIKPLIEQLTDPGLAAAVRAAQNRAEAFDAAIKPLTQAMDLLQRLASTAAAGGNGASLGRDLIAARLGFAGRRYDAEARLNQSIANLYELQVRRSNLSAERHHLRSTRFFFGMLAAQAAVIISTLAMAAQQRNLLWTVAAVAGLLAIGFAIYVYLYV